jgi:hypothetical protein
VSLLKSCDGTKDGHSSGCHSGEGGLFIKLELQFDGEGSGSNGATRGVGAVTATPARSNCFIFGEGVGSGRLDRGPFGGS